ncbi:hypothetical protein A2U01_0114410, partial [Trifolium medium]|nr:hypothetical protein [Trifolium medium]
GNTLKPQNGNNEDHARTDLAGAFGSHGVGPSVKKSGDARNGKKIGSGLNNEDHARPDLAGALEVFLNL